MAVSLRSRYVICLSVVLSSLSPALAQEGKSIDVLAYCRQTYGGSAARSFVRSDAYSWRCTLGGRAYAIDMDAVCKVQHGPIYVSKVGDPKDAYTWRCVEKTAN